LGNRKGIRSVKTFALEPFGMAVNICGWVLATLPAYFKKQGMKTAEPVPSGCSQ